MTNETTPDNIIALPFATNSLPKVRKPSKPPRAPRKVKTPQVDAAMASELEEAKKKISTLQAEHLRVVAALDDSLEVPAATPGLQKAVKTALSIAIPLAYMGVSRLGSVALSGGVNWLAWMAALFALALMVVSLPHAAESIKDLTHSGNRVAWALAIVIDGVLLTSEAASATVAATLGLESLCQVLVVGVALFSAAFNYHAFTSHK